MPRFLSSDGIGSTTWKVPIACLTSLAVEELDDTRDDAVEVLDAFVAES